MMNKSYDFMVKSGNMQAATTMKIKIQNMGVDMILYPTQYISWLILVWLSKHITTCIIPDSFEET